MIEVLVWLLISQNGYNGGNAVVVERFKTQEQCEHVKKNLRDDSRARCIQANILVTSGGKQ